MTGPRYLTFLLAGVLMLASGAAWADVHEVRIGVLAFRGAEDALKRWSPTAAYLSKAVDGATFRVVPLTLSEMSETVARGDIHFVLTNTGNYVNLEHRFGVTRIATLRAPGFVIAGNAFGAVIFTRADRADIKAIKDLKGKKFMAVNKNGFGGFQMAWRELQAHGIDPFSDFSEIRFSGFPQDNVAYAVLNGDVDAGTFRSGALENMAAEGDLNLEDFKILSAKQHTGFPFLVSTRLYPEWPFSKLNATSETLAQKVAIALLGMSGNSSAALIGKYGGWTVPLDYQPVHELFKELRIGPYQELGRITFTDLFKQYGHWLVLVVVLILLTAGWAARIEYLVARRTRELSQANLELEKQMAERRRLEDLDRRRQAELAHVSRLSTMGEMASGFAHELNQPLSAITNYAKGCVRRLRTGSGETGELLDAMEQVSVQAERAAKVIRRIRSFVRKETPR
ncbi:MAG: PhnD/SsuA/transferrin family substrate-binding protein, partial [Rhodospirillales bacterium]|nr:PhnD/SsuA/transferrin family substrate-binding protein [Rhodospirillales bacterium]